MAVSTCGGMSGCGDRDVEMPTTRSGEAFKRFDAWCSCAVLPRSDGGLTRAHRVSQLGLR